MKENESKVFIVEAYTPYDGSEILAVFLDKKLAEDYVKSNKSNYYDYTEVVEYPLEGIEDAWE